MGAEVGFRCIVRLTDELGPNDHRFYGETPYDVIHVIDAEHGIRHSLPDSPRLTFLHVETGTRKAFQVDFQAIDESGFRCPTFRNESGLDEWLRSLGIEIEQIQEDSPATPSSA
jgi:hypothetical protein